MMKQEVRQTVLHFMRKHHMADGGSVLAAVSGGADSVCLLLLLKELKGILGIRHLEAFHLNHGLRGQEADRDEDYVKKICADWDVPLTVCRKDVAAFGRARGISTEAAGRELRYQYMEAIARKISDREGLETRIATAHHKDDNAETVLFHFVRGTGLLGLSGIAPVREAVIRPLLCLTRREIEEYLSESGTDWCEDSSNKESAYTRNKIRNILIPWLEKELNPRASEHILQMARVAGEADEYFAKEARRLLGDEASTGKTACRIETRLFDGQPGILKEYIVREMILRAAGGRGRDISGRHIRAVMDLLGPGRGTHADLPFGLCARRDYTHLEIMESAKASVKALAGEAPAAKNPVPVDSRLQFLVFPWKKDREIPKNQCTKWFDYGKIENTLSVRTRVPGDYFQIAGGRKKALNRYFIDEKIPESERDHVLLLADGHHILWIVGYRISEYYKVTETTQTILQAVDCKGENHG